MFKRVLASILAASLILTVLPSCFGCASGIATGEASPLNISVVSGESNDLWKMLEDNYTDVRRFDTFALACEDALQSGTVKGIMLLADSYQALTAVNITQEQYAALQEKNIRLYVEYPRDNTVLGIAYGGNTDVVGFDRGIVVDSAATGMEEMSLLYVHGARYVTKAYDESADDGWNPWLVNATVTGYDTASFGLTDCEPFVLLEENGSVMVAATKLSQFITGRYAPYSRWQSLWAAVLKWLSRDETIALPQWTPAVNANYTADEEIADMTAAQLEAVRLNSRWYLDSGFVLSDKDAADYETMAGVKRRTLTTGGTGEHGIIEAYVSGKTFDEYGMQRMRFWRRADCNGESAGALALAGLVLEDETCKTVAANVMDWLLTESYLSQEQRADPESSEYGLLAWHDQSGEDASYYQDDNAKAILGMICAAAALEEDKWDQRILEAIVANFRTTGVYGFKGSGKILAADLRANGWEYYYNRAVTHYSAHYEALMWACYLWAYDKTGYEPFLTRTRTAITMMMDAYEAGTWKWQNGLQQERAKMVLPLAWLARVEPTQEHLQWLDTIITDLMEAQKDTGVGAIPELMGSGTGTAGNFSTNSEYGTHEAPVIQENGDPCTDALYTIPFAMLGINEANAVTENKYKEQMDALAEYMVRIQQVSETYTEFDGVWFRGFDYEKWETYGSDGDTGWGVWCVETGWTQAWVSGTLAMRAYNGGAGTTVWELSRNTTVGSCFEETAKQMLGVDPSTVVSQSVIQLTDCTLRNGTLDKLLDGIYGEAAYTSLWVGTEGDDVQFLANLGEVKSLESVRLGFLQAYLTGIRIPTEVTFEISENNADFTFAGTVGTQTPFASDNDRVERLSVPLDGAKAKYIRVTVKNPGVLPDDYEKVANRGKDSWVFMDEFDYEIAQATKADLYGILEASKDVVAWEYTTSTGLAFGKARADARAVYENPDATAQQLHAAYAQLKQTYESLVPGKQLVYENPVSATSNALLTDNTFSSSLAHTDAQYYRISMKSVTTAEMIVDMQEITTFAGLGISCLSQPRYGVMVPDVEFYVSDTYDGTYTLAAKLDAVHHPIGDYTTAAKVTSCVMPQGASGRYLKVVFQQDTDNIPAGTTWFCEHVRIDELLINAFYSVSANAPAGGTVHTDEVAGFGVFYGQNVTVTLKPDAGYVVDTLTVNGAAVTPSYNQYTLENATRDVSVYATFRQYTFAEEELPVLVVEDHAIEQGSSFDPYTIVTAGDKDGNDLTAQVEVIENTVKPDTVGTYHVTYQVMDSAGAVSRKRITVYVMKASTGVGIVYVDPYVKTNTERLTDGIFNTDLLHYNTQYYQMKTGKVSANNVVETFELLMDLKEVTTVSSVGFSCLSQPKSGVMVPDAVIYASERLGGPYVKVAQLDAETHPGGDYATAVKVLRNVWLENDVQARYIKMQFSKDYDNIPSGVTWECEHVRVDELLVNVAPADVAATIGTQSYATLEAALTAYTDGYIKLRQDVAETVTVQKNAYLDLNGCDVAAVIVADGVTLSCMDSRTDDYTVEDDYGYGKLISVTGTVAAMDAESGLSEDGYLKIKESTGVSFHRVNLQLTAMTLRASDAGVYYKSNFAADEIVEKNVSSYGVALSVKAVPEADNMESACKYSTLTDFSAGGMNADVTSTLLKGVMKTDNAALINNRNSKLPVYGRAYILTEDGQYIFGRCVSRSFRQQVEAVDAMWTMLSAQQQETVVQMYLRYSKVMDSWQIPNIQKAAK